MVALWLSAAGLSVELGMAGIELQRVGAWPAGAPAETGGPRDFVHAGTVVANRAYVAAGAAGLHLIDLSQPANPKRIGITKDAGAAFAVRVVGDYAYVAGPSHGLEVWEVHEPSNPLLLGRWRASGGFAWDVEVHGSYAYLADFWSLHIIDIRVPEDPVEVGVYEGCSANALLARGDHLFCVGSSLLIFSISEPTTPQLLSQFPLPNGSAGWRLRIAGTIAYVSTQSGQVFIIDIADPAKPRLLGEQPVRYPAGAGLAIEGGIMVVGGDYQLRIFDVRDPVRPKPLSRIQTLANRDLELIDGIVYAFGLPGMEVFDVRDPVRPRLIGSQDVGGSARRVVVSGPYAYVADYDAGMQIIDVRDPPQPVRVGRFRTLLATGLSLVGSQAWVTDEYLSVQVADLTNPSRPIRIGGHDIEVGELGGFFGVTQYGPYALLSANSSLQVHDMRSISPPIRVAQLPIGGAARAEVVGELAFVARPRGMDIVDMRDPTMPRIIGQHFNRHGNNQAVQVVGSIAFLTTETSIIDVVDVSDPKLPRPVAEVRTVARTADVHYHKGKLYVATLTRLERPVITGGVEVFDARDPVRLVPIGRHEVTGGVSGVYVDGEYVYLAAFSEGLIILRESERPELSVDAVADGIRLSWPSADAEGFGLEVSEDLETWVPAPSGSQNPVTVPTSHRSALFYRLSKP
jgi:hypothetical protein